MAIKPSPTIAGKLRKLFSNNKQTIEPAIGDSIPGGSGGGANVLTLYAQLDENEDLIAYKDEEMTQPFSTYEEAETAVKNAGAIKVYRRSKAGFGAPSWAVESYFNGVSVVTVRIFSKDTPNPTFLSVYLCKADVGEVNPN